METGHLRVCVPSVPFLNALLYVWEARGLTKRVATGQFVDNAFWIFHICAFHSGNTNKEGSRLTHDNGHVRTNLNSDSLISRRKTLAVYIFTTVCVSLLF